MWYQGLWSKLVCGLLLSLGGQAAGAQSAGGQSAGAQSAVTQTGIPSEAIVGELRALASHAALIFVGQIVSIDRHASVVEVSFRVEQAVSGTPGARYTMREWAGLWPADHRRYTVGERVLCFAHRASAAGFSSPVHGAEGLVPVAVQGADAPELLDIRRVAASVVRAPGVPLPTEKDGAIPLQQALRLLGLAGASAAPVIARLSVPLRAHPPAAMQPREGWLQPVVSSEVGSRQPTGMNSSTERLSHGKQ